MKKVLFIALFIFGAIFTVQAQSDLVRDPKEVKLKQLLEKYKDGKIYLKKGSPEYTRYYDKLKTLEKQINNSPSQIESDLLQESFYQNLNQEVDVFTVIDKDKFNTWIDQNIKSTKFRNVDEAKAEWLKMDTAIAKNIENNSNYFDYMSELAVFVENYNELVTDVTTSIANEGKTKN